MGKPWVRPRAPEAARADLRKWRRCMIANDDGFLMRCSFFREAESKYCGSGRDCRDPGGEGDPCGAGHVIGYFVWWTTYLRGGQIHVIVGLGMETICL